MFDPVVPSLACVGLSGAAAQHISQSGAHFLDFKDLRRSAATQSPTRSRFDSKFVLAGQEALGSYDYELSCPTGASWRLSKRLVVLRHCLRIQV